MIATNVALVFVLAARLTDACWPHTHSEHKLVVVEVQEPNLSTSERQREHPEETGGIIHASPTSDPCASCISGEECRNGRCQPVKVVENQPPAPREQPAPATGKSCFDCVSEERCDWDTRVCVAKSRMGEACKKTFDCADFPRATCDGGVCKPFSG